MGSMSAQAQRTASEPASMMLVPLYCVVNADFPTVSGASTTDSVEAVEEDSVSSWDEELCSVLWAAYNSPKQWTTVEHGLCLRARVMPCLENLFVEDDETGEYRRWGLLVQDWRPVAAYMKRSFFVVDATNWTVFCAKPDVDDLVVTEIKASGRKSNRP